MVRICTIVLNYNNQTDTSDCIDSLISLNTDSSIDNLIILVDNASTDQSGYNLSIKYRDRIIYLASKNNYGYAAGNNLGIKRAIAENAEYICILNNDTIVEQDFITPCINFLAKNKETAFVSPVIMNYSDNYVQSTGGDILFTKGFVSVKNNGKRLKDLPEIINSDYLGGACLIFRTSLIDEIDLIPENYFLFFEETEWCWKAKKRGYRNICLSSTYIRHKGSASIDNVEGLHLYMMERNRVIFLRRNAPDKKTFYRAIIYLFLLYGRNGLFEDKKYFKFWGYMLDGLRNRVNQIQYPFVNIPGIRG